MGSPCYTRPELRPRHPEELGNAAGNPFPRNIPAAHQQPQIAMTETRSGEGKDLPTLLWAGHKSRQLPARHVVSRCLFPPSFPSPRRNFWQIRSWTGSSGWASPTCTKKGTGSGWTAAHSLSSRSRWPCWGGGNRPADSCCFGLGSLFALGMLLAEHFAPISAVSFSACGLCSGSPAADQLETVLERGSAG